MKKILAVLIALVCCLGMFSTAMAEEPYEIAVVVKVALAWFDDMEVGIKEAAEELGVNAYMLAPDVADAASQIALIESCIAKGVDAICVVPNDPAALEPTLAKAREAGIVVIGHEAASLQNVNYDVEAFANQVMGARFMDNIVKFSGKEEGNYAFVVGNLTAETHMERFEGCVARNAEKYPGWKLLTETPIADNEDTQTTYTKTLELIDKYGDELDAIITCSSASPLGVAQALREKGLIGEIASVGSSVPSMVEPYVAEGSCNAISLWRPADAGYVQVWAALECLEGRTINDGDVIPRFGEVTVEGTVVTGGEAGCVDWDQSNMTEWIF